jgi:hypothetical protein
MFLEALSRLVRPMQTPSLPLKSGPKSLKPLVQASPWSSSTTTASYVSWARYFAPRVASRPPASSKSHALAPLHIPPLPSTLHHRFAVVLYNSPSMSHPPDCRSLNAVLALPKLNVPPCCPVLESHESYSYHLRPCACMTSASSITADHSSLPNLV